MSLKRFVLVAPLFLLLAACASNFQAEVSRFHRLQQPQGQTIKIVPQDEKKVGSLEFATYASMIAPELTKLGYRVVGPNDKAQLIARVDYAVSDGNTVIRSYPDYAGFYDPFYWPGYRWRGFGPAYMQDIHSYIVYPRRLDLQIVRGDVKPSDPDWMVYEGHAMSQGTNNRLQEVMPLLIQALFTNFPGQSGQTNKVTIKLN